MHIFMVSKIDTVTSKMRNQLIYDAYVPSQYWRYSFEYQSDRA